MLYGYLFGLFNLLEGIYILLFVCVQHDKVIVKLRDFIRFTKLTWLLCYSRCSRSLRSGAGESRY